MTTYTPFLCNLLNSLWSHLQHINYVVYRGSIVYIMYLQYVNQNNKYLDSISNIYDIRQEIRLLHAKLTEATASNSFVIRNLQHCLHQKTFSPSLGFHRADTTATKTGKLNSVNNPRLHHRTLKYYTYMSRFCLYRLRQYINHLLNYL